MDASSAFGTRVERRTSRSTGLVGSRPQHLRLGEAPRELERPQVGVAEVTESARHQAVAVLGPRALGERIAHDRRHAGGPEHIGRLAHRRAHDLERRRRLLRGIEREQRAQIVGDACRRGMARDRRELERLGARLVVGLAPRVEDRLDAARDPRGERALDAVDDGRGRVAQCCERVVFAGGVQLSSPTRRSASAGSSTSPVTNGPNSA
jgi:hypothetical protein